MSITTIRIKQQQQQIKAIATDKCSPKVASYKERDPVTGDRKLITGDGGEISTEWISPSNPLAIPPLVVPSATLGLPGYAGQK